MAKTILIVDDEPEILRSVGSILLDEGYQILIAQDGIEALKKIEEELPDLVLLDIWLPGMDGIEVLSRLRSDHNELPVIMISGHGTIETAVKATKLGAYDFIEKPLSWERLTMAVQKAINYHLQEEQHVFLRQKEEERYQLTGKGQAISKLKRQIEIVAPTSAWVLIRGENGTGKEIVAHAIHRFSKRKAKPFVEINCAAIPEELIESELFGHEEGAFTGTMIPKRGKFDLADEGTLFLDEIGDMSLKTQARILRILQEQKFERIGGTKTIQVDVRVVASTNKDLEQEITKGTFREDLYYRLNVIPLEVPALRERKEDIPDLVEEFLEEYTFKTNRETKHIAPEIFPCLMEYDWPGNVRELKNMVERLIIMTPETLITLKHLPPHLSKKQEEGPLNAYDLSLLKEAKNQFEREFIVYKLQENEGNITQTAAVMGIERSHLHKKIKVYGIKSDLGEKGETDTAGS